MQHCGFENQTYVSLDSGLENLISVKNEKRITGAIGSCIDDILCKLEDRKCRIIGILGLGEKQENGSYNGVLGLLQTGKADIYLKGEQNYLNEPWLERSPPMKTENLLVVHSIHSYDDDVDYFDLIENLNFGFEILLYYFVFLFVTAIFCLIFSRLTIEISSRRFNRRNFSKKLSLLFQHFNSFSENYLAFRLFFLFFGLFVWFSLLFLGNNIKTNKVVVDVSKLVKNRDDIMNTDKVFCFLERNTEMNIATHSPKNTLLSKLFYEKTWLKAGQANLKSILENDHCFLKLDVNMAKSLTDDTAVVLSEAEANFHLILYSEIQFSKKYWVLDKGLQEFNVVTYYGTHNPMNKEFAQINARNIEHGIVARMYHCMKENAKSMYQKKIDVFYSIENYIQESTEFSDLTFKNFRTIFLIYFSLLSLYLVCFIVHCGFLSYFLNLLLNFLTYIVKRTFYYVAFLLMHPIATILSLLSGSSLRRQ